VLELAATVAPEYRGLLELVNLQTYQAATENASNDAMLVKNKIRLIIPPVRRLLTIVRDTQMERLQHLGLKRIAFALEDMSTVSQLDVVVSRFKEINSSCHVIANCEFPTSLLSDLKSFCTSRGFMTS
jgi:hypothetical protein